MNALVSMFLIMTGSGRSAISYETISRLYKSITRDRYSFWLLT